MSDQMNLDRFVNNGGAPARSSRVIAAERAEEPDAGPDWNRALGAIRRYKWLVVLITIIGLGGSFVLARRIDPNYKASATIWISAQNEQQRLANDLGPIRHGELLDQEAWVDLVHSYVVLDPVVADLHLNVWSKIPADSSVLSSFGASEGMQSGRFTLKVADNGSYVLSAKDSVIESGNAGDSIGAKLGWKWKPRKEALIARERVEFTAITPRQAAERLAEQLQAHVDRNATFLRLELAGPESKRTARIVNAVAARYVEIAADLKKRKLSELARILDEQLASARGNLDRADADLEAFRVRSVGLPTDLADAPTGRGEGTAAPSLVAMNGELDRVHHDRQAINEWLAAKPEARSPSGPMLVLTGREGAELSKALDELTQKRADLRAMNSRYAENWPPAQRLNEEIITLQRTTIPTLAGQLSADLATRERDMQARIESQSRVMKAVPGRMLEQGRLQRAQTIASDLYTTLQGRYQEARLAEASSVPDVRVLDAAAAPLLPASDNAPRALLFGVAISIAFAMGLAVMLDRIDPRVRYPAEVSHSMGLTILGAVPHLRARRADGTLTAAAAEEVTEALRGVRVALTHAAATQRPMKLTLTSPGPGDGKSFITANLGVSFALAGYRTIVIDADIRRGVLHRGFGAQRRPGLTDYLRGNEGLKQIVQKTSFPSLSIIGCGTRTRLAPELLGGPTMSALINELNGDYDVIICDSPPLAAGVDPLVLGAVTGQMLLVLRTGVSLRSVVEAKLVVLDRLPVNILGAVLNDVPPGDLYRPYAYYLPGYQATDEVEPVPALPAV